MLLGRLRIRGKLGVLVLVPLLLVAGLTVPLVLNRVGLASRADQVADSVRVAGDVGSLLGDLQQERMLSVGYLLNVVDRADLTLRTTTANDRVADLRADLGDDLPAAVSKAIDGVEGLADLRADVLSRAARPEQVVTAFRAVTEGLVDSLQLLDDVDVATKEGRQVVALDTVLRINDMVSSLSAIIVIITAEHSESSTAAYTSLVGSIQTIAPRINLYATQDQIALFGLAQQALNGRLGIDASFNNETSIQLEALGRFDVATLYPSMESYITLGHFVERKIITDVTAEVDQRRQVVLATAYSVIALALLVLIAVVLMSVVIARAVAQPLTRLTVSAERVATVAEAELRRVADEDSEDDAEPIHLEPVDVRSGDEIGDLARAFDRVQVTAARLVERQVTSRRNVAQMFGHVGRRTQNLVGRQLALIDRLEHEETDPRRLQQLYRLDHVSSRLRRNAGSLVVLSGSQGVAGAEEHIAPLPLADVVRLALGEIEEYTRVDVQVPLGLAVKPAVTGDLVLLLAEVMENSTVFSPPHTRVTVSVVATGHVVRLRVVDHGLGLSPERMVEENDRLAHRERLDLAPTEVLGLFVVGRLARKHGLGVALSDTPGGGVTVTVDIGPDLLVQAAIPEPAPVPAPAPTPVLTLEPESTLKPARGLASVRQLLVAPPPPAVDRAVARAIVATAEPDASFNAVALDRATRTIGSGHTWNAFAPRTTGSPAPAVEPPPAPATPPPAALAPPPPAAPAPPVIPARPAVVPAPPPAAPPQSAPMRGGLRQRVPGAQLPEGASRGAPPAPSPAGDDAASARALVEEFEAGVRRAQESTVVSPAVHDEAPPTILPPRPGPRPPLSRRVPGATLPAEIPPNRPAQVLPDQWSPDPEAARDLIEQFESGVARALQEGPPQ